MNRTEPITASAEPRQAGTGPALSVTEGYCINLRGRIDACDLCQRVCHAGAITLMPDEVAIDPALCVDCGACVPACPAGAITHDSFDPEALLATAVEGRVARVACVPSSGRGAAIPCHRMLDARLMAALFAEGAERIEVVGTGNCRGCPGGDARPALASAVRTLKKWFGEAAPPVVFDSEDRRDAAAEMKKAIRRRHLLRVGFRAFSANPDPAPEASAPSFDDLRFLENSGEATRGRPVPYQQALAVRRTALPFRDGSPVGATGRLIGEDCSGCMICAELCPTGALNGEVETGRRNVSFDPALCTNCTLCLKVCPMEVVSARALRGVAAATAGRSILFARSDRTCTECGAAFASATGETAICPDCENDREMDDEWLDMLSG